MTAATMARCGFCGGAVAAGEAFAPYRGAVRCRDVAACGRRQLRAHDPTILLDEDLPRPPATGGPPGAACAVCGTSGPGLYERLPGQYVCQDRDRCQRASVGRLYLTAWSDESPDRYLDSATMRATIAAGGAQIPPERPPYDPQAAAVVAWQDSMSQKR